MTRINIPLGYYYGEVVPTHVQPTVGHSYILRDLSPIQDAYIKCALYSYRIVGSYILRVQKLRT